MREDCNGFHRVRAHDYGELLKHGYATRTCNPRDGDLENLDSQACADCFVNFVVLGTRQLFHWRADRETNDINDHASEKPEVGYTNPVCQRIRQLCTPSPIPAMLIQAGIGVVLALSNGANHARYAMV